MRERIVVTGLGVVSPLGCSVEGMWRRLVASESGLRRLPDDLVPDIDAKVAGLVPSIGEDPDGFDPDALIPVKDRRKMDRFIQFTLVAADQALRQSGWTPSTEWERVRTATIVASGIGGFQTITDAVETVRARGAQRLSPFTVPAFLVNQDGRAAFEYDRPRASFGQFGDKDVDAVAGELDGRLLEVLVAAAT